MGDSNSITLEDIYNIIVSGINGDDHKKDLLLLDQKSGSPTYVKGSTAPQICKLLFDDDSVPKNGRGAFTQGKIGDERIISYVQNVIERFTQDPRFFAERFNEIIMINISCVVICNHIDDADKYWCKRKGNTHFHEVTTHFNEVNTRGSITRQLMEDAKIVIDELFKPEYETLLSDCRDRLEEKLKDKIAGGVNKYSISDYYSSDLGQKLAYACCICLLNLEIKDDNLTKKLKNQIGDEKYSEYFKALWDKHYLLKNPDVDNFRTKELSKAMVLVDLFNEDGKTSVAPFSDEKFIRIVSATSGSGKSTMLHCIALTCIFNRIADINETEKMRYKEFANHYFGREKVDYFPIFIECRKYNDIANEIGNEDNAILKLADCFGEKLDIDLLDKAQKTTKLLFLVDALDEVRSGLRSDFVNKLVSLINTYPGCSVIMTTRFYGGTLLLDGAERLTLGKFGEKEINTYLDNYAITGEKDRIITGLIKDNKYAKKLAENPFALSVMVNMKEVTLSSMILNIINSVIGKRWKKTAFYDYKCFDVRRTFSYIAYKTIFDKARMAHYDEKNARYVIPKGKLRALLIDGNTSGCFSNLGITVHAISDAEIDSFVEELSCQSGIIGITINQEDEDEYWFQEKMIVCYLATEFLVNYSQRNEWSMASNEKERQNERPILSCNEDDIYKNICTINTFVRREIKDITEDMLITAGLLIAADSDAIKMIKWGLCEKESLLWYLLIRAAMTYDEDEKNIIKKTVSELLNGIFGEITFLTGAEKDSDLTKMVETFVRSKV